MPQSPKKTPEEDAYDKALRRIKECQREGARGQHIALHDLGLTTLPPEIGQLTALTRLDLRGNQLATLPPEIGQLTALTTIILRDNRLTTLPLEIGRLAMLTVLYLDSNHLTTLPPEIGQLTALKELYLPDNHLITLPPEIDQLTALTALYLSSNQLTSLPPEIGQLSTLAVLNLADNRLTNLPPEIGQLSALTVLNLAVNQLTNLPPEIGQLATLTYLYLDGNQLTSLPPEIGQLTTLTELHLHRNQLRWLPPEIGQLSALMAFRLDANQLMVLPPEIGHLSELKVLHLQDNQLMGLPREFGQLSKLTRLFLHGNPVLGLPAEVLGLRYHEVGPEDVPASPAAILDYYFFRLTEEVSPLNEVKLLLVGRGEAGKTSVSRALRGEAFDRGEKETPGIEIQPWTAECPEGKVRVHLWDFAGQEITHETHRFFLSQRSLYLVVLDGRGGQQMEEAEYWLSHVVKYGTTRTTQPGGDDERSPVIVVLNKWQSPGPYDVEKRRLQREYPNIRAFVETDCAEEYGIAKLKESIFAALKQMPAVWQEWPGSYRRVRDALEKLATAREREKRKHFLTWQDYRSVCVQCKVTEEPRQAALAENLNALGIALYYGEDERLRDTRVLNPNWAANGLYGLVRGVQRRPHRGQPGRLWADSFTEVLAEGMKGMNPARGAAIEDYPPEKDGVKVHEFLLNLMQDRELGFLAGEEQGHALYLLPGLLALDEPEPGEFDVAAHLDGAELRLRYLYELLPAGVMSRFIVRTHVLSDDYFRWQRGAVLGWGDARALVMAERRRNPRVEVYLRGGTADERQKLAGVVRSNMEEIHRGLPEGLRGKEELKLDLPGEQFVGVEELKQLEAEGKEVQAKTPEGFKLEKVEPQLEQVQPAGARREDAPRLKVFVSYAHADYKAWNHLKTHLDVLKNEALVSWWFDGKIRPGAEWDDAIRREMNEADIVVLLVSNAFFASTYIKGIELQAAQQRRTDGAAEVLPVLLEPTPPFAKHEWLPTLQATPSVDGRLRAVTSFRPAVNGWSEVQQALRAVIAEVAARRKDSGGRR